MSSVAIAKSLQRALALVFAAFALLSAAPALAQPVKTEHVELELISQGEVVPGQESYVALRQVIEKGWHTYWRNSGDSGEATKIAWTLPPGWKAGDIVWKTPERLPFAILMNYGYSDEVILPVPITVPADAQPGSTVPLKAQVSFLVCADICIPGSAALNLDLKVAGAGAPAADPKWSPVIADALAKAPKPAGLNATTEFANGVLKLSVTGDAVKGGDFPRAYFFPFSGAAIDHAKPQAIEKGPEGLTLSMTPSPTWKGGPLAGVLTLGDVAYEVDAAVGAPLAGAVGGGTVQAAALDAKGADAAASDLSLPLAALFAFLGGLILNLMPCVFPVLSMKAASLAGHAHEVKAARAQGVAFLVGVLVTFLVLAGLLLAARAAGEAVGWGFQLQSPPVTAGLAILMLLVALNLSGLFEIGTSVQGAGSGLASRAGLAGAFFTGVLAVVVAAPCTAPFMAGALGYAVSQPPAVALTVFAALGLGFALPFTALAFAPPLLRRLPRPGPWMAVLKTVLAFPMYGAAAWLAWVFAAQAGQIALGMLLAAAIAVAFAAWLFGQGQRSTGAGWRIGLQLVLPLVLIAAVFALAPVAKPLAAAEAAGAPEAAGNIPQEPWDPGRIAALQAEGRVVFVDFTADWCVTCKVNEGAALKSKSVADAFQAANAVFMVADWTLRDERIAAALAEHGRTGVPLYLMYPAGGGGPEILPQLLTEGLVKKALEKAAS